MKCRDYSAVACLGLSLTAMVVAGESSDGQNDKADSAAADVQKSDDEDAKSWMKSKLVASQNILADLTHGDLGGVTKNARRMQIMNLLEDWLSSSELRDTSAYRKQMNRFEFATKELSRNADDGDLAAALDSYVDMTRTCVECHKLIRDVPDAK